MGIPQRAPPTQVCSFLGWTFHATEEKNFFSFLKLKTTSRKIPQEVVLPVQLGLAPGYVLPLNRNWEAWPATSWFSQSLKWVTPAAGGGGGRLGAQPGSSSSFSLSARSLRSGLETPVQDALSSAWHLGPRNQVGGGGATRRGDQPRPRPFHGAPRGRVRKTPTAPGESRGWGEPRRGRMGE